MRIQTQVIIPGIEKAQALQVEVESGVITFYLGDKEVFNMDFIGNFDEFFIAIMRVWGDWNVSHDKVEQK